MSVTETFDIEFPLFALAIAAMWSLRCRVMAGLAFWAPSSSPQKSSK